MTYEVFLVVFHVPVEIFQLVQWFPNLSHCFRWRFPATYFSGSFVGMNAGDSKHTFMASEVHNRYWLVGPQIE